MGLDEQIEIIVKSMTGNNIPSEVVKIIEAYPDNTCDITTHNGVYRNVRCSGSVDGNKQGLLVFEDGEQNKPFVLLFNDLNEYYTKEEIDSIIASGGADLKNYVTKTELNGILSSYVVSSTLSSYALRSELFSGSYNDLTEKPSIPTKTSDLTNDSGFLTTHQSLNNYYRKSEVDNGFAVKNHTHSQYLTEHQSLSDYLTETEINQLLSSYVLSSALNNYYNKTEADNKYSELEHSHMKSDITDFAHTHDDRYYTESEIDTALNNKSDINHVHGSLSDTGTLNSDINSVNKIAVTDSSNNLKTISQLPYAKISGRPTDISHLSDNFDYIWGNLENKYDSNGRTLTEVAFTGSYTDLENIPSTFTPSAHTHEASQINVAYNDKNGSLIYASLDDYVTETEEIIAQIDVPSKLSEILTHIVQYYDYYQ